MRSRTLIVSGFAAALLIGGSAQAQNTGAGMPAGKAAAGSGIGAPAALGPVGGSSLGAPAGGGFGAAPRVTPRPMRPRAAGSMPSCAPRASGWTRRPDSRLGLDAAAAQRAQKSLTRAASWRGAARHRA